MTPGSGWPKVIWPCDCGTTGRYDGPIKDTHGRTMDCPDCHRTDVQPAVVLPTALSNEQVERATMALAIRERQLLHTTRELTHEQMVVIVAEALGLWRIPNPNRKLPNQEASGHTIGGEDGS